MGDERTILFITPPYHCGVVEVAGRWIPLQFVYLAGVAGSVGWRPTILDAMSRDDTLEDIASYLRGIDPPDVVGISSITASFPASLATAELVRAIHPRTKVVLGGVHPTFMPQECLYREDGSPRESVDYVVCGEGERTLAELLRVLESEGDAADVSGLAYRHDGVLRVNPERPFLDVADLERTELPWDLLDWPLYKYFVLPKSRLAAVSSARGCDHDCTFCSQQKFWKQSWRGRSPSSTVDEIRLLSSRHGVDVVLLTDEYPTGNRDRWEELLDRLIHADLGVHLLIETRPEDIVRDEDLLPRYRRAGIIHVYVGVEATDQATLDLIRKDVTIDVGRQAIRLIQSNGMITETSFVLGFPDETRQSIARTLGLAREYDPDFAHFLALAPWPYADIYEDMRAHVEVWDYSKYNLVDPVIKPKNMTLAQVDSAIVECYRKFYMSKLDSILALDEFRKLYMLRSMRLIMRSSFLQQKLGSLGRIPVEVERSLSRLGVLEPLDVD